MTASSRQFNRGLYLEHIEEGAFLYDQCRQLRSDALTGWLALESFERRLDAHLDALEVGGDAALAVSRERAAAGEPGEVFVATSIYCRLATGAWLSSLLGSPLLTEPACRTAVAEALAGELPRPWEGACVRALATDGDPLLQLLSAVISARRLATGGELHHAIGRTAHAALPSLLEACGRLREPGAARLLKSYYVHEADDVRNAALRAGLRLNDDTALQHVLSRPAPPATLALVGGREAARHLLLDPPSWTEPMQAVDALGLLGDLSAVRPLIELLDEADLGPAAADALYVITGAPLFERVHVAAPPKEDELFEKELERFRSTGEVPRRVDGLPYGETVHRLSLDAAVWNDWLSANAEGFDANGRYRFGRLCSPAATLRGITLPTVPKRYRTMFADELLMRYGIDIAFDAGMPVQRQRQILQAAIEPVLSRTSAFEPGAWYAAEHEV